ncbi:hypothetical protein RND81_14G248100 [Saponaria officinalis]|uniref:Uncharacterized protein n=1 Tax=Saponaria officinalis TaxID=3572 RepID=A0AAW1GTC9_SAPOF
MKAIRLKDDQYCQYLTAGDDQLSVTLTKPNYESYNPKNTEWRLERLSNSPENFVGRVRLWSIYNKALTFDKDPGDYTSSNCSGSLKQRSWPPSDGGSEADSEWQFVLKGSRKDVVADLNKWSKSYWEHFFLYAGNPSRDHKPKFNFESPKNRFSYWLNNPWLVEVVVTDDNSNHNSLAAWSSWCVNQNISKSSELPLVPRQGFDNKAPGSFETSTSMKNSQCHCKNLIIDQDTNLSTIVNQKASVPPNQPRPLMQSLVGNKFMPVKNDQEDNHQIHDKNLIDQEKTQDMSVRKNTSTPAKNQPCMNCSHGARYNDIGQLHDHYTNMLSRCQVGQVFVNVSPTSTGFHAGAGYKYDQYINSGGNVNGSGIQKNGDVSLYSEINRSRDNNAIFVNYEYE